MTFGTGVLLWAQYRPTSQSFWKVLVLFELTRTQISESFVVKVCLIGLIRPKDWFCVVSPGIGVFDDEEKSVVQLLDFGCFLRCGCLTSRILMLPAYFLKFT